MPRIDKMFAFICEDQGPDDEGVIAASFGNQILPLVGADIERVESLKLIAQSVANQLRKNVKIVIFNHREEVGIIQPKTWLGPI